MPGPALLYLNCRPHPLLERLLRRTDVTPVMLNIKLGPPHWPDPALVRDPDVLQIALPGIEDIDARLDDFDFHDGPAVAAVLEQAGITPTALLNTSEIMQPYAQALATQLGVPALSREQVVWLRDKHLMKSRLRQCGVSQAPWDVVTSPDVVRALAGEHERVVVKGRWTMAACREVHVLDPARDPLPATDGSCIVEPYMDHPEWEFSGLVVGGELLTFFVGRYPAHLLEALDGSDVNATIAVLDPPQWLRRTVGEQAQRIVTGFGLDRGHLHFEMFVDLEGERVWLHDIALRPSGCRVAEVYERATGVSLLDGLIDVEAGFTPALDPTRRRHVGEVLMPPPPAARLEHMTSEDELRAMDGVVDVEPRIVRDAAGVPIAGVGPGSIGPSSMGSASVMVEGDDPDDVEARMRAVLDRFTIVAAVD